MAYRVITLPQAEHDALEYAAQIAKDSPATAGKWLVGLEQAVAALSEMPGGFVIIPETGRFRRTYRQFHYHSHRVVFFVDEGDQAVVVARVYHGARDHLRPNDLP